LKDVLEILSQNYWLQTPTEINDEFQQNIQLCKE
jgi:hypothetical protein